MGLLSDVLSHLLGSDPLQRRAGLRGLLSQVLSVDPVVVRHPSMPADLPFEIVNYRTPSDGSRSVAVTLTIGLAETQTRELIALTLANVKDPSVDRIAWLLYAASTVARDAIAALPEGTLGRSAHTHVACAEPWPISAFRGEELGAMLGARLDLVLPITAREARFASARGVPALTDAMRAQLVSPWADRPAGQTALSGANLPSEGEP